MSSRLNEREAEELLLHGDPVELGRRADAERRKRFDDTVTFIVDRNINYTNVCVNECRFCAFFRASLFQLFHEFIVLFFA